MMNLSWRQILLAVALMILGMGMLWAEVWAFPALPVLSEVSSGLKVCHKELRQKNSFLTRPLGREQYVRVFCRPCCDGVLAICARVPELEKSNGDLAELIMEEARPNGKLLHRVHKISPLKVGHELVLVEPEVLKAFNVHSVASVEASFVEPSLLQHLSKPVWKQYVSVEVQDPAFVPQVGKTKVDRTSLVEGISVVMHDGSIDKVDAEFRAKSLGRLVVWVGDDHDSIEVLKVLGQSMGEEVRVVLADNHSFNLHGGSSRNNLEVAVGSQSINNKLGERK